MEINANIIVYSGSQLNEIQNFPQRAIQQAAFIPDPWLYVYFNRPLFPV